SVKVTKQFLAINIQRAANRLRRGRPEQSRGKTCRRDLSRVSGSCRGHCREKSLAGFTVQLRNQIKHESRFAERLKAHRRQRRSGWRPVQRRVRRHASFIGVCRVAKQAAWPKTRSPFCS